MQALTELKKLTVDLEGKLSEAMSNLTHLEVKVLLKDSGVMSITEVHNWLQNPNSAMTTVYIPIMGDVTGDIFFFLPQQTAQVVADLMIGNPLGTTQMLTEFESSALKELGNITTGVIVTEIANMLKVSMMLTVPNLASDMIGALVDQVLIEYGESGNELLIMNFPFTIKVETTEVNGSFVLFFDQASSKVITEKLQSISIPEAHHE